MLLGPMHGNVSIPQNLRRLAIVRRSERNANAAPHKYLTGPQGKGRFQHLMNMVSNINGFINAGNFFQQNHKFIAPKPSHSIPHAQTVLEALGNPLQELIPHNVPKAIIDHFKVI